MTPRQTFAIVVLALVLCLWVGYVTGRQAASLAAYESGERAAIERMMER